MPLNLTKNNSNQVLLKLTYASLIVLALSVFTSVSLSAIFHILIFVPGVYFTYIGLRDKEVVIPWSFYFLFALLLASVASVLLNLDNIERPLKNILKTKYFVVALISVFPFYYLKKNFLNEKRAKILINIFIISTTVATLCGLIGLWSGYTPIKFKNACHPTRACGLYGMYMTYGYGISLYTSLSAGVLLSSNHLKNLIGKNILIPSTLINFLGMIFSYARGGWLGFILSFPFLYLGKSRKKFLYSILILGITFITVLATSSRVQQVFLKRIGSNEQRISHFMGAIHAFKERPFLGIGYKNYEPQSTKIKNKYNLSFPDNIGHAHSNYLEHLASTGAIGLLSFLLFLIFWMKESYSTPFLFIFVLNFFTSGFTQYTFGDGENLFLILGIYSLTAIQIPRASLSS